MKYSRNDGETDLQLIYRITRDKDAIGTWQDVADILNDLLGTDYSESKFRKQSHRLDEIPLDVSNGSELIALEKARVKYRDERNEYRRIIREEARKESYEDLIKRVIAEHVPRDIPQQGMSFYSDKSTNDLIIHLTDLHAGIDTKNAFNTYNTDILGRRMAYYRDQAVRIAKLHHSENAYVIVSEIVSGLIHENLRCENNENLIEQFLIVSDYISKFLEHLSQYFTKVNVYVCPGNHSRVSPKKDASLKGENFDHLLIPFLQAKLQNYSNICCFENKLEESICSFDVRGNKVFAAHGDKDNPSTVVQKFSIMFGVVPNLVYLGHRHRNGLVTVGNTKIIESGSVSGVDNYALDLRCNTFPEQTISVIDESGLVCLYDIQLGGGGDR